MKKKKNKEYKYSGESVFGPIWEKIAEDMNEQLKLGLIYLRYNPVDNIVHLDIIDSLGLAIWYNNKFNKIQHKEMLDKIKKEKEKTV